MPLKRLLPRLVVLSVYCVSFKQLQAQQSASNPAVNQSFINPTSIRAQDSLFLLHERYLIDKNRLPALSPQSVTGINRNITTRRSFTPVKIAAPVITKPNAGARTVSTVCYTFSGRDFLQQDSLVLYTNYPTLTADANLIVQGEYLYY